MNKEAYAEYLQSPEWKNKREWALKWANYRCQVCDGHKKLHVHHRTYSNVGMELPGDLTILCGDCHFLFHGKVERPWRSAKGPPTTTEIFSTSSPLAQELKKRFFKSRDLDERNSITQELEKEWRRILTEEGNAAEDE